MVSVAVIGAGVTGLTAAYCLKRLGARVVVYEADQRIGGVVKSVRQDGYLVELGPSSMSAPPPEVAVILSELGLDASQVQSSPAARIRYIVKRGRLLPLPLTPSELLTSRLLSNTAKLAVFGEPLVESSESPVDESVAGFIRRRFNQEVLDYVVNPFVAGTFAGDPEQLSVRHALPQLHALERTHGSVMRGFFKQARARRSPDSEAKASGGLLSFRGGLQEIPQAFGRELQTELRLRSPVTQLRAGPDGWTVGAAFQAAELYDAVVYAAPAHALDDIDLDFPSSERLATLSSIVHPPVAVLALGFRRDQVDHPLDGFGFLSPEVERRRVLGAIFSSTLFPDRAPENHLLLTVFAGGARDPDFVQVDSNTLTARVLDELRLLLGISGEPTLRLIHTWPKAIPQYVLGYGRFKDIAQQTEQNNRGLVLAGTYRDGISLGDAISSGERASTRVAKLLGIGPVHESVTAVERR
ncbi:MAG TPA: protoporphyrinogen oxidase [Gemmatimonadales bacterium]|nr:protoporphyrinogen oxidase [Gemmatimonadales bacterium]